jgi:FkbM family methyltransferase
MCKETREIIRRGIDWKCKAKYMLPDENLGCRLAVSSAVSWFFQEVEEGIILEDDCVPNESFFEFCGELLGRYRKDREIMHIGGSNHLKRTWGEADYYFSIYNQIWGWATWRRAWQCYDVDMKSFQDFTESRLPSAVRCDERATAYWMRMFRTAYDKRIDTWDYQWTYAIWRNSGLSITPRRNLVSNIGFGEDATHTREIGWLANIPVREMDFPLKHPKRIVATKWADRYSSRRVYGIHRFNRIGPLRGIVRKLAINMLPFGIVQLLKRNFSRSKANRDIILYEKMLHRNELRRELEVDFSGARIVVPDFPSFYKLYKAFFIREVLKFKAESETPVFIDLGSNIGLSIAYMKSQYPRARVLAIELNARLFECLRANLARLGLNDVEAILGNAWYRKRKFSTLEVGAGGDRTAYTNGDKVSTDDLSAGRLFDSFERIDLVRIAFEGDEEKVLGAIEGKLNKVCRVFVEYHSEPGKRQDLDKILAILIRNDFRICMMTDHTSTSPFVASITEASNDIGIFAYKR